MTLEVDLDERLPVPIELAAYFVASEGLANIGKYAEASHATIRVSRAGDVATIAIEDDGIGGADAAGAPACAASRTASRRSAGACAS